MLFSKRKKNSFFSFKRIKRVFFFFQKEKKGFFFPSNRDLTGRKCKFAAECQISIYTLFFPQQNIRTLVLSELCQLCVVFSSWIFASLICEKWCPRILYFTFLLLGIRLRRHRKEPLLLFLEKAVCSSPGPFIN